MLNRISARVAAAATWLDSEMIVVRFCLSLFLVALVVHRTVRSAADNLPNNEALQHERQWSREQNNSIDSEEYPSDDFEGKKQHPELERSSKRMLELSRNGGVENNLSGIANVEERRAFEAADKNESRRSEAAGVVEPREEDLIEAADFGLQAMNDLYYVKEPELYKMGLYLSPNNPARFVAAFNEQSEEARQLAKYGYATLEAATKFRSKFADILRQVSVRQGSEKSPLRQQCPKKGIPQCPPASLRYRTSDGSCNNLKELWWGSAMSPMQRFVGAVYEDSIQSVRRSVRGTELPSARRVCDYIHKERDVPLVSVTHMLMQWGQFIDHDVTATAQSRAFNGTVPQCCLNGGEAVQPPEFLHPECLPILIKSDDSRLGGRGVRCMEFVRSGPVPREDCEFGTREQLSQVTSFIDASTVYSSSARQSDSLRIFRNGLMQYGKLQSRRPMLPREEESDLCRRGSLSTNCFKAGDVRLSEQPALISLHVVFLRLHNRLATQMAALNQHWPDEKIFQETRKILGAIVQHITYREFLPIVLGPDVMKIFDIELLRKGFYDGYDETVNPNIANEFSTAAYRFGHSLVQSSFMRFNKDHQAILNNVTIHEEFMNPANLESAGSVDRLLLGLVNQPAQRRDEFITQELTDHLFQTPGFPFGMDLASINVQRGRDHGLAGFAEYRLPCGLSPVRDWAELGRTMAPDSARKFRELYAAVEDVDLFSAGLAEKPVPGGLVGPTFACIIAQQFRNLRKGDRFWYENPFPESGFTAEQLRQIRRVSLAQVLCRTTESIESVQPFVMLAPDKLRNQRLSCADPLLGQIELAAWAEPRPRRARSAQRRRPPSPTIPNKTRISQHNRIAVKRPLGPHENLTIVVNNNAVNAPLLLTNSLYGSNVQVNNRYEAVPTSGGQNAHGPQYQQQQQQQQQQQPPPSSPPAAPSAAPRPYFPHNFHDPDNPNPPSYGLSPRPVNDYLPSNEFFAYSLPSLPNVPTAALPQSTGYSTASPSRPEHAAQPDSRPAKRPHDEKAEQLKPNYLHTRTTVSDVRYVVAAHKPPRRQPELPRPIAWLQDRASPVADSTLRGLADEPETTESRPTIDQLDDNDDHSNISDQLPRPIIPLKA